ncbi:hypothetical protein ACH3XW_11030 [Acanthocheilonema viteae]
MRKFIRPLISTRYGKLGAEKTEGCEQIHLKTRENQYCIIYSTKHVRHAHLDNEYSQKVNETMLSKCYQRIFLINH